MTKTIITFLIMFLLLSCSTSVSGNGSGSEVTNGFTVGVATEDGKPTHAKITVRPQGWYFEKNIDTLSDTLRNAISGVDGKITVKNLRVGNYRLTVFGEDGLARVFDATLTEGDPVDFGTVTVVKTGEISGVVNTFKSGTSLTAEAQLEGTDMTTEVGHDGTYHFSNVPSGHHKLRIFTSEITAIPVETDNFEVLSEELVLLDTITPEPGVFNPNLWAFSGSVKLNTGSEISGDSLSFLMRITPELINLSTMNPNGSDLRITYGNDKEIPFELISYESGVASISIIQKEILNNETRNIKLHWGNNGVQSKSEPWLLHDTTTGSVLMMHGEEESVIKRDDATLFKNNSTEMGSTVMPSRVDGVVGFAMDFDGVDDYLSIPSSESLNKLDQMTIAFWTKFTPESGNNGRFFSKCKDWEVKENQGKLQFSNESAYVLSAEVLPTNKWVFITIYADYTKNIPNIRLFQNSVEMELLENTYISKYKPEDRMGENDLYLGSLDNRESYLNGKMDEVRIWNRILQPYEIEALYQSEKIDASLFTK